MDDIIEELLSEPNCGENNNLKISFIEEFKNRKGTPEWLDFVMQLADFISSLVCEKQTKILPLNQYEDAQKSLNAFLNINESILKAKLLGVCNELQLSVNLAGRLTFRIATKLLQKGQCWVLRKMKSQIVQHSRPETEKRMSQSEEEAFLITLGGLFRDYFKRAVRKKEGQSESACIKDTFVEGQHPFSREQFLNTSCWFSGEADCITVSVNASCFFKEIELNIISCLEQITTEDVLEIFLEDSDILGYWYFLTNAYFSEDRSLIFMRDLVSHYVNKSSLLRQKKRNREEDKTVQATTVAQRTHLQRNYSDKNQEDLSEDVE